MMFLHAIHLLIVATYVVLPAAVLGWAVHARAKHGQRGPMRRVWLALCGGIVISSTVCVASAAVTAGKPIPLQAVLAAYFATGLLLLLRGFDYLLWRGTIWALRLRPARETFAYGLRALLAMLLRTAVLFAVGLPYFLAASITYRPRTSFPNQNPQTVLHHNFQTVEFTATDGTKLVGWWIPADQSASTRTVLLCHGWAGGKGSQLFLVRRLLTGGYNVLTFDFRAHGESAGNLTSFGDLEQRDVLGAVHWLAGKHPQQCQRLVGLGVDTGGAALLAAAVDPSPDGQRIDAIAVYGTFDTLSNETRDLVGLNAPRPLPWMAQHIGLALAGAQVGTDLPHFSPAAAIAQFWPRPVLVVHGIDDQLVPLERGEALYESASQPKEYDWVEHAGQEGALHDDGAASEVKDFFDHARSEI